MYVGISAVSSGKVCLLFESIDLQSKQTLPDDTTEIPMYIDPGFWVWYQYSLN